MGKVGTKSHLTLVVEFLGSEKKFTWAQILFWTPFSLMEVLGSSFNFSAPQGKIVIITIRGKSNFLACVKLLNNISGLFKIRNI